MKPGYSHLSLDERIEIEKRYDRGESARTIAGALSRSPATISRELRRGRWRPSHQNAAYRPYRDPALHGGERTQAQYRAARAHRKAQTRGARSHQRTRLCSDEAITYLITKLRDGWTPEMIAGRVRIDFPDTPTMNACPETIYRFIYAPQNRHRRLYEYLPHGRKKHRKYHGRKVHSSKIPHRVSIHHRPEQVNARTVFGHWEGDSVLGTKSRGDGIHTEVERHTRMMAATKVEAITSRNIAGIIQPFVHIKDLEFEQIERVMNVNFWGTLNTVKAFLPGLLKRPVSSLVNVSSMGAILPVPGQSAYGASKAAVRLLSEGLYAELQGTGVSVTEVFPGAIGTEITKNSGVERAATSMDPASAKTTSPEEAARQIADAVEKKTFMVHIGSDAKLFDKLSRLIPQRAIGMIAKKMKDLA